MAFQSVYDNTSEHGKGVVLIRGLLSNISSCCFHGFRGAPGSSKYLNL